MSTYLSGTLIVPGIVAFVFLLLITYLRRQTRSAQFRLWQLVWVAYFLHFICVGLHDTVISYWPVIAAARIALVLMTVLILVSGRRMHRPTSACLHWTEAIALLAGITWAFLTVAPTAGDFIREARVEPEVGMGVILLYAAWRFCVLGFRRDSLGYRVLATSLGIWALLLTTRQLQDVYPGAAQVAPTLSAIPQLLLGLSMVMVMFEHERAVVQENALALSTLEVDSSRLLDPQDMEPAIGRLLNRVMPLGRTQRAWIYISEPLRGIVPSVQRGFSAELLAALERDRACEPLCDITYRRGGIATVRYLGSMDIPGLTAESSARLAVALGPFKVTSFTAIALHGRDRQLGVLVFPHEDNRKFGTAELRVLLALTMQIGTTLDNYLLMYDANRRTREYEMLTQIGQVISSRLDPDEVLMAIHHELGRLFDTGTFYVAFMDGDQLRFEFETIDGELQSKRARKASNGLAEHIIRTGEPLLVRADVTRRKHELGLTHQGRGAKSFVGVPVKMNGRTSGVICALNFEREFVYEQRDMEVLRTAAGQLSVAMENALLYSEASRRAQYLSFLNNIANTAISSQGTDEMLAAIVGEIQKNFDFDHIGIGVVDYSQKDIEIKAEAGKTARMLGRRIPIGAGIMGRVARSGEPALVQNTGEPHLLGLLPEARSVICIPLKYGETLLGLLNVESCNEGAFSPQEDLLLNTLADLLATALHNSLVFQKMEQQSIIDGLTGIKTRNFFMEALQSEFKRASRSGRAFSIVLVDLDKFKEVNDSMGHLEGDLVLAQVGHLLEQKCRQSNIVARFGGDEFIILMPETGVEQAQILAERLRLWLATDPMLNEHHVTGSFGVASFPLHGATIEEIIRVADAGMYVSKHAGGNRVSTADVASDYENISEQRKQLHAFVDRFIKREHLTAEDAEELIFGLERLAPQLPQEHARELLMDALRAMAHASERRETGGTTHGEEVATYAEIIGRRAGLCEKDLEDLRFASLVHDIGKFIVPARILNHPAMLSEDEFALVMSHTVIGGRLLGVLADDSRMREWVRNHHERFDGSGYPDHLAGEAISVGARIIAIADAYVIMTTDHPFANAKNPAEALRELENSSHLYDAKLVAILAEHVRGARLAHVTNA